MNHKNSFTSPHFLVLLCFALLLLDKTPLCGSFDGYTTCSNKYRCGIIEADFPFWGDGRPEGCGHPSLKLNCEKNNATIDIKGVKYQVLEVDQKEQIFKIARTDYMNGICSPKYGNTSLDLELFEYAPASGDITFFYGCSSETNMYMGGFNCSNEKGFIVPGSNGSAGAALVCRSRVTTRVPDPVRNYGEVGNVSVIEKALGEGFRVKYKVDYEACEGCKNSNGVCGYDWTVNETTCYCRNGPSLELKTCPLTPGARNESETLDNKTVFAQDNDQYIACNTSFHCANMEVRYPFWAPPRPKYCGHPEFELNCSGEAPVITISSLGYRVLQIDSGEHLLEVARTDYWNNNCPKDAKNASLNLTFSYASDTQNLTLYYGCPGSAVSTIPYQFSCPGNGTTLANYYATDNMNVLNVDLQGCEESAIVRISNSAAGDLAKGNTVSLANLTAALNSGFGIEWEANNSRCEECATSGGVCGFNLTTGGFACYCKDRPYGFICGSDQSPSGSSGWSQGLESARLYFPSH